MSVTDDRRTEPRTNGQPPAPRDGQFDKTPPQDVAAEQCVLGGMLLSKDAIADVVEILKTPDFYRPIHATIFDTILEIYGRGEPADSITVAAALADSGDLVRIGGAPYLHTLIASVPTAANAAYYARIVAERAVLRRLVEAGTRIVQLGYGTAAGGSRDVDDIVDLAQQAVYDVTEKRVSEDFAILADMLQPTLDEIEAVGAQGGVMTGVPTGFSDLDRLLNGLHPGQLIIVAGRPGLGKALALDTPLPTPQGWTTMGEVEVGDQLLAADGTPTTVTAAFEVRHGRPCYEVEFSDGSTIVADAEHLWKTTTRASRRQRAEAGRTHQWPTHQRRVVAHARRLSDSEPDSLVSFGELVGLVGEDFRHVLHVVAHQVGPAGEVIREYVRAGRPWRRRMPAYSRRDLLAALQQRVERLRNEGRTADHESVVTTAQIAATLRVGGDDRLNHAVENARPLALPHRDDLLIPPYTLGAWLGDGTSAAAAFTTADLELVTYIEADGFVVRPLAARTRYSIGLSPPVPLTARDCVVCGKQFSPRGPSVYTCGRSCGGKSGGLVDRRATAGCRFCGRVVQSSWNGSRSCADCRRRYGSFTGHLRAIGVLGDKHIPMAYLRASEQQRRQLLAGLLDTDGTVTPTGSVQFGVTSRRLAEDVRELVVSLGYRCSMTTRRVKGRRADTSVAHVLNFTTDDDVFRLERKRIALKERRACVTRSARTGSRYIVDVRPVPSVPVRCVTVENDEHLYLAGRSMIPTHNSTASMDFARNAAIRANQAAAIFSLEMSKVEIVMRLLSAEARVPLHVLRSGQLSDDDWTKLARCMGEISEAPLFVDDTPSMNLMEIRAKARRLKQRHDLKMIVVDYLQLMTSPKRTESRQQEVADLSRGLKLLAKEVECPVIAVSQLNRGPEQRTDKRPQLSDLRESGCLTSETRLIRADNNSEVTLGELLAHGAKDIPVWALDEKLRYTPRTMTHAFPSGNREVFRMTLASGKQIDATANHPFLTFAGWLPLGDLSVGARVAVPRHIPPPLAVRPWPEAEVVLLAHLLGDGSFVRRQPIRYATVDESNLAAVTEAAKHFGISAVRDDYAAARVTTLRLPAPYRLARGRRNPIAEWLDSLGLFGLRSHEKFVPQAVAGLPKDQITTFLRHLWATDGSVTVKKSGRGGRIYFSSTSRRMLEDVSRLLLRYGISARLKAVPVARHRPQYTLDISGRDDQLRFLREIGVHGARSKNCVDLIASLEALESNTNVDTVPREVWTRVREILTERKMSHREFAAAIGTQFCGSALWKRSPSRSRLANIAAVLDAADLDLHATNDIFWDEIVSIESIGHRDVYDATVMGTHNFIANGIATHNSIEQDADVVILLHRDDYYDKESPRAGEADFIVAKHRNGPTDTVTVAAQLHLSRFVDMAIV
ncbi:replicative DNA helicase [Micromonospora sp. WMMD882]|uniref:replicative DNA helicase n=1 Tax=Micromonospora sp. WMMD882 TaxID=3015151 RepID=UPI00248C196E|nr:replicative DNA helicase [Micromonospora sp. WMMD882]WBB78349.1 replicative DNA helicase [Micromonospora sp. WMMD882]